MIGWEAILGLGDAGPEGVAANQYIIDRFTHDLLVFITKYGFGSPINPRRFLIQGASQKIPS